MSPEQHHDELPYWNDDRELELVYFGHAQRLVHVRAHIADERYYGHGSETLLDLSRPQGERTYLQSRLYIHAPPETSQEFPVASTQSWYYPGERAIVFWECVLEPRYEPSDPREDLLLRSLWLGYERYLIARFPRAERLLSTWEDTYGREAWQGFLNTVGYHQTAPAAFTKLIQHRGLTAP